MDKRQPQGIRGTSGVLTAVLLVIGWSLHGVGWEGEAFAAGADIVAAAQSRLPPGAAQASSPRSGERSGAAAAGVATGADAAGFVVRAGAASARPLRTFAAPLPAEAEAAAGGEPVVCNAPARSVRLPAASRRVGAAARPELTAGSTKERPDSVSSGGAAAAAISVSASRSLTGVAPVVEPQAQGDLLGSFWSPTGSPTAIAYDPFRRGVWFASEERLGDVTLVYMVSVDSPPTVVRSFNAVGVAVATDGRSSGVCVLPNGNLLFADFQGDLAVIDDYLFEVDPDVPVLIDYWPLDGSSYGGNNNTSTDGTSVDSILDVGVSPRGQVFVTSMSDNNIYELELTPGNPGTWRTVAVHAATTVGNAAGLDRIDCPDLTGWLAGDWNSTTVAFLDGVFQTTASFAAAHDANVRNPGVLALRSRGDPMRVWTVDWATDRVGIFDSGVVCGEARQPKTWVLETPIPQGSMDTVAVEYQGEIYVVAGYGSNGEAYKYNPRLDRWYRLADQPSPTVGYPVDGALAFGPDGLAKIYILPDTTSAQANMMVYDIYTDSWSTLALGGGFTARWAADLAVDPGANLIYISGGATSPGNGNLNELWSYNPVSHTFTQLAPFTTTRDFHASCCYRGKLFIAGGTTTEAAGFLSSTQVYDIATNTWRPENADLGPLPSAWWGMGDAVQGNRLWLMGGSMEWVTTARTGYLDLERGSWVEGPPLDRVAYRLEGDLLGGDPYACGGAPGGFSPQPYNQRYVSSEPRILIYADDAYHRASNTLVDQALKRLGLSYAGHYDNDFVGFRNRLAEGPWDLVIMANENWSISGETMDALQGYAVAGGRLVFQSWGVGGFAAHPLLATLGVGSPASDYEPPDPVYWWQPAHRFFRRPQAVPQPTSPTGGRYGTYGQRVEALPGFLALAGYTEGGPAPGEAALVLGNEDRTVFKGFLDGQNDADRDGDGIPDGAELWFNLISNTLWPGGAVSLPPVYQLLLE